MENEDAVLKLISAMGTFIAEATYSMHRGNPLSGEARQALQEVQEQIYDLEAL